MQSFEKCVCLSQIFSSIYRLAKLSLMGLPASIDFRRTIICSTLLRAFSFFSIRRALSSIKEPCCSRSTMFSVRSFAHKLASSLRRDSSLSSSSSSVLLLIGSPVKSPVKSLSWLHCILERTPQDKCIAQ